MESGFAAVIRLRLAATLIWPFRSKLTLAENKKRMASANPFAIQVKEFNW